MGTQVPTSAPPPNLETAPRIAPEALDALYRGAPMSALVGVVEAFFLSVLFWRDVPAPSILWWLAAFAAVRCLRIGLALLYQHGQARVRHNIRFWAYGVVASALAQALAWGFGSWVLQAPHNIVAEMALHIGLAAVVLGSVNQLAHHLPALAAYTAGVFGPLILRDVLIGQPLQQVLALASVLTAWYVWRSGWTQAHLIAQAARQQQEKQALIDALRHENEATTQARAEAEAAHASKAQFLATISHDLRQPLNALLLLSHTLRNETASDRVHELSGAMAECVGSMGDLVNGLLELSRLDARAITPHPAPFALRNLLDEIEGNHKALAQAQGLDFSVACTDAWVFSDRALLARVLSNLVSNAIRYTPTGFVAVEVELLHHHGELKVRDSGVGMDAAELPRIFDEHYQIANPQRDRSQGWGLGLATVQRLCNLLGLSLTVESTLGQGSCFGVSVPLAKPQNDQESGTEDNCTAPETHWREASTTLAGRRILVIEDDPAARRALANLLQAWGCTVVNASDLASALQQLPTPITSVHIDAMVVDLRLPGDADGIEAIAHIRRALRTETPALLITADTLGDAWQRADTAGLPLLPKPIAPMKLRAFLQSQLTG